MTFAPSLRVLKSTVQGPRISLVYTCVALLKHCQSGILNHMQNQDLMIYLKEEAIPGFKLGHHLEYMQQLEKKYRKIVLADMVRVAKK